MPEFRFESSEHRPSVVIDCALQASEPPQQLHVIREPLYASGRYYVACSCGRWQSEGQATPELARQQTCAFARAEFEAWANAERFKRDVIRRA